MKTQKKAKKQAARKSLGLKSTRLIQNPRIEIRKSERKLTLLDGDEPVKTYTIALGLNAKDHKRKEGDDCTPEGTFYICTKNDQSKFHLFLGLSYPNDQDARRGLKNSLIDENQYAQITDAISKRKRPPWNTPLGGEIGIHGGGAGIDWTQGSIAMENPDIEELFLTLNLTDQITILP